MHQEAVFLVEGGDSLEGHWEALVMKRYTNINFKTNKIDEAVQWLCILKHTEMTTLKPKYRWFGWFLPTWGNFSCGNLTDSYTAIIVKIT